MRTRNLNAVQYSPDQAPTEESELPRYIYSELLKLQGCITALSLGHLDVTHVAPSKPREGDIRLADGVNFNPTGAGKGFYGYYNSSWHLLG